MTASQRLASALAALSGICPSAQVRVNGSRPVAPADVEIDADDLDGGDIRVIICLKPEYNDDEMLAESGYTAEWAAISKAIDALFPAVEPSAGFDPDGSEWWGYSIRAEA